MTYRLRDETYEDEELDELSTEALDLLRADAKSERAHVEVFVKRKQVEFKSGSGPGLRSQDYLRKELEIAELRDLEYRCEFLLLERGQG